MLYLVKGRWRVVRGRKGPHPRVWEGRACTHTLYLYILDSLHVVHIKYARSQACAASDFKCMHARVWMSSRKLATHMCCQCGRPPCLLRQPQHACHFIFGQSLNMLHRRFRGRLRHRARNVAVSVYPELIAVFPEQNSVYLELNYVYPEACIYRPRMQFTRN